MSAPQSQTELFLNALASAFAGITTANGYRTTVAQVAKAPLEPEKIAALPAISLVIGRQALEPADTALASFTAATECSAYGYVRAEQSHAAALSLLDDMQKCLASFARAHLNNAQGWRVAMERMPIVCGIWHEPGNRISIASLRFLALIRISF